MSLCHLYNQTTTSLHVQEFKTSFDDSTSLDINDVDTLRDYDAYVIELESADKNISAKLKILFKEKTNPLIYFIISQKHNLMLFQLTYFLSAKDVITKGQNSAKVIEKIKSDIKLHNKPEKKEQNSVSDLISSRATFIQLLKEKIAQRDTSVSPLSVITVSVQNILKIQKDLSVSALENYLNDLVFFMEPLFEEKLLFTQLDRDFYVILFQDIDFDEIKSLADEFHEMVLDNIAHKKLKFLIDVFTLDISSFCLGEIVTTLNNIKTKELSYAQLNDEHIQYTSKTQTIINEKSVLSDAFENKVEFKLLNIYNGLVINTPSKILKQTQDSIYVSFEQLQGVVMKMEKETILQSSIFMQDILATIKIIDLKKKIAVLENFKFLNTNANSRKFARVTTSSKIPITLHKDSSIINGQILDLSIKSIAVKSKYSKRVEELKNESVKLVFNIPNYRFDDGYTQLQLNAKVIVILPLDTDGNCKVVCDLDGGSDDESIIKEYVYDRQKELIIEVKKMSKLN